MTSSLVTGEGSPLRVRHGQLHFFIRETLKRVRLAPELASHTADAMVGANLMGEDQDGVAWLPGLVTGLSTRHVNPAPDMQVVSSSGGTAVLDGDNGPGPAIGWRAMIEAISGANRHGIGSTAVRRSNRMGSPGYFAALALSHQMAGIAMATEPVRPGDGERLPASDPVALGIAVPTAETAAPMVLSLNLPAEGDERAVALGLALEFLMTLGGAALPEELAAEPHPDPTHRGTGHFFLAFRSAPSPPGPASGTGWWSGSPPCAAPGSTIRAWRPPPSKNSTVPAESPSRGRPPIRSSRWPTSSA